jgi:hypothetical protein
MAGVKGQASKNRQVRQEELRLWLSNKGLIEQVFNLAQKISDESIDIEDKMLIRYKLAIETNLKLANKYIPDLKAVEMTGEAGSPLQIQIISEFND